MIKVYSLENLAYLYYKNGECTLKIIYTTNDYFKITNNSIHGLNYNNFHRYGLAFLNENELWEFVNKEKAKNLYFIIGDKHKLDNPTSTRKEYYYNIKFNRNIDIKNIIVKPYILIYNDSIIMSIIIDDKKISRMYKICKIKNKIKCH